MPSKTWSIMATGTPVLASFDSETDLEELIKAENVGLFSEADDVAALRDNIMDLFLDLKKRNQMGINARVYVQKNLSRENCTSRYIDVVQDIIKEEKK